MHGLHNYLFCFLLFLKTKSCAAIFKFSWVGVNMERKETYEQNNYSIMEEINLWTLFDHGGRKSINHRVNFPQCLYTIIIIGNILFNCIVFFSKLVANAGKMVVNGLSCCWRIKWSTGNNWRFLFEATEWIWRCHCPGWLLLRISNLRSCYSFVYAYYFSVSRTRWFRWLSPPTRRDLQIWTGSFSKAPQKIINHFHFIMAFLGRHILLR